MWRVCAAVGRRICCGGVVVVVSHVVLCAGQHHAGPWFLLCSTLSRGGVRRAAGRGRQHSPAADVVACSTPAGPQHLAVCCTC